MRACGFLVRDVGLEPTNMPEPKSGASTLFRQSLLKATPVQGWHTIALRRYLKKPKSQLISFLRLLVIKITGDKPFGA